MPSNGPFAAFSKIRAKTENKAQDEEAEGGVDEESHLSINGVYIKAFCSGVQELLSIYKEHILGLEREYLKERALTIFSLL